MFRLKVILVGAKLMIFPLSDKIISTHKKKLELAL